MQALIHKVEAGTDLSRREAESAMEEILSGRAEEETIVAFLAGLRTKGETVGELVGFARAISDGVSNAYVSNVAVLPDWRGRGIGREIVRRLVEGEGKGRIRWVLHARGELHGFYGLNGFEPAPDILWRDRQP